MKKFLFGILWLLVGLHCPLNAQQVSAFEEEPCWEEHFNGTGFPASEQWEISWMKNTEHLACYLREKENVRTENGNLLLTLRKGTVPERPYTSGRIISRRTFSFGKLEFRAKCPVTKGVWNAIWLRDASKEECRGEIDVLEHIGCWGTGKYQLNFHLWGTFAGKSNNHQQNQRYVQADISEWHLYTLEWYEDRFVAYVDGQEVCTFTKNEITEWPFNHEYRLIVALAYGGNWAGGCGLDDNALPQTLYLDWIKYYELKD